ncbi:MAG: hypothetical protein WCT03_20360 [Candidatus Obscuribacterales bacterium]|jgi:hypothetical protein
MAQQKGMKRAVKVAERARKKVVAQKAAVVRQVKKLVKEATQAETKPAKAKKAAK